MRKGCRHRISPRLAWAAECSNPFHYMARPSANAVAAQPVSGGDRVVDSRHAGSTVARVDAAGSLTRIRRTRQQTASPIGSPLGLGRARGYRSGPGWGGPNAMRLTRTNVDLASPAEGSIQPFHWPPRWLAERGRERRSWSGPVFVSVRGNRARLSSCSYRHARMVIGGRLSGLSCSPFRREWPLAAPLRSFGSRRRTRATAATDRRAGQRAPVG